MKLFSTETKKSTEKKRKGDNLEELQESFPRKKEVDIRL